MFHFVYTMNNDQNKVTGISTISDVYHSFVLETQSPID